MSASLNEVRLIGNVGADPEPRSTEGGKRVVNLSLATSNFIADREYAEWHRLVFWGSLAERVEIHVRKGTSLFVAGRLQAAQWKDVEGIQRYGVEIVVENFQLLGAKAGGGHSATVAESALVKTAKGRRGRLSKAEAKDVNNPF